MMEKLLCVRVLTFAQILDLLGGPKVVLSHCVAVAGCW